jgi:glycosyltransferase involved in cell wall biosynthesis
VLTPRSGGPPRVCLVSHRLGGRDGVSVEADKWRAGFEQLGWRVTRAAGRFVGHRAADVVLTGLWADRPGERPPPVDRQLVARLMAGHDLVVLDNVGSLPSAPEAAMALQDAALTARTPMIVRHHDPSWDGYPGPSDGLSASVLPLRHPAHLHIAINELMRAQFARRWPQLHRLGALWPAHNLVDVTALAGGGEREGVRAALGVAGDEILLVHPARAVPRKNIPAAVHFTRRLACHSGRRVRYWLTADDSAVTDDGPLDPRIVEALAQVPGGALRGPVPRAQDMYAAADLVLLPSTWEGWGLPVIEAAAAGRLIMAGPYPVLEEIRASGIRVFGPEEVDSAAAALTDPGRGDAIRRANHAAAVRHFDAAGLPDRLRRFATRARSLALDTSARHPGAIDGARGR